VHLFNSLSFCFKLPAKEAVFDSPVHSISGDFPQQVSGNVHLKLISSPFHNVSAQDELSSFLK